MTAKSKIMVALPRFVALLYYIAPVLWYAIAPIILSRAVFLMSLGLWYPKTDSLIFEIYSRIGLIIFVSTSALVSILIMSGRTYTYRTWIYIEAIAGAFYIVSVCILFPLHNEVELLSNFAIGRGCLIASILEERQILKKEIVP